MKVDSNSTKLNNSNVDIFRDTHIRYLGYANEVGEAFRSLVHARVVRFSYAVATGYVCADAVSKGSKASESSTDVRTKSMEIARATVDTFIWQGLASVIIPGLTINRLCWATGTILSRRLPPHLSKWITTAIGLAAIPVIIKPIDNSVDYLLDRSIREWWPSSATSKIIT